MRNMSFSRTYPSYHPKYSQPTLFIEKILLSQGIKEMIVDGSYCSIENLGPKWTTIRPGHLRKPGDWFQPYFWGDDINPSSGRSGPYHSKQVKFCPPIQIKKTWDFEIINTVIHLNGSVIHVDGYTYDVTLNDLAKNDGLSTDDFLHWFKYPNDFLGQVICWNENISYE